MTAEGAKQEADDLVNLLKSPGWQRFVAFARRESSDGVESLITSAMDHVDDAIAVGKMRQAIAGKRLLERVLRWPEERSIQLAPPVERRTDLPVSRRGSL